MMTTPREDLLEAVEEADDNSRLLALIKKHESKNEDFDLKELIPTLSAAQSQRLWNGLYMKVTTALLSLDTSGEAGQQQEGVKEAANFLHSVITIAMATLAVDEPHVPNEMYEAAVFLHGVLSSLPDTCQKLCTAICRLCETWWLKDLEGKQHLAISAFQYMLQQTLQPKAAMAEVKRVWGMREVLATLDLMSDGSEQLRLNLQTAYMLPVYLNSTANNTFGVRFLAYVMTLNADLTSDIHKTIKNQLPYASKSKQKSYGDIYLRAWKSATGDIKEKVEVGCIQDLMYRAIHAQTCLFPALRGLLFVFHSQRVTVDVTAMLLRLYQPILWRSFKVANAHVRSNAGNLLVDAFPLEDTDSYVQESDGLIQQQLDALHAMLSDPSPDVRCVAVRGLCHICNRCWEMMPVTVLKTFLTTLVEDLAWDSSSADVRASVLKGLMELLDNHLSHPLLKKLLPLLTNMFHDTSDRVRIAATNLLLKVKGIRSIKFWSIVPIDHIMARLAIDTQPICRRLVKLLYNSFLGDCEEHEKIARCITVLETWPHAARIFYQSSAELMSFSSKLKFLVTICRCLRNLTRKRLSVLEEQNKTDVSAISSAEESLLEDKENRESSSVTGDSQAAAIDTQPSTADEEDEELNVDNEIVMSGLLETVVILWNNIHPSLQKSSNKEAESHLQQRFCQAVPDFFKVFKSQRQVAALIVISGFLPPSAIPTVSRGALSKLKHMGEDSTTEDYSMLIESMCRWNKQDDILELIIEWLDAALHSEQEDSQGGKKVRQVMFCEPVEARPRPSLALTFTSYLLCHPTIKDDLLRTCRPGLHNVVKSLKKSLACIEQRLAVSEPLSPLCNDGFLVDAFNMYLKLSVILEAPVAENPDESLTTREKRKTRTSRERSIPNTSGSSSADGEASSQTADPILERMMTWSDLHLTSLMKTQSAKRSKNRRRMMNEADGTMLSDATVFSEQTVSDQTAAQSTMLDATAMLSTTLSDTLLGRKRTGSSRDKTGTTELASNLILVLLEVANSAVMVGVTKKPLMILLTDYSLRLLKTNEVVTYLPSVLRLLYQITELMFNLDLEEDVDMDMLPEVISSLIQILASLVKKHPHQAQIVLPDIRPAFSEVINSYYKHHTLNQTTCHDVMSTVVAASMSEMTHKLNQDSHLEAADNISTLPIFCSFLLSCVNRKNSTLGLYISELWGCVESGALEDILSLLAVAHILQPLTNVKYPVEEMKECLTSLQLKLEKTEPDEESNENSPERYMYTTGCTMVKECMTQIGMVA